MRAEVQRAIDAFFAPRGTGDLAASATRVDSQNCASSMNAQEAVKLAGVASGLPDHSKQALDHDWFGTCAREDIQFSHLPCERYMAAYRRSTGQVRVPTPKSDKLTKRTASTSVRSPDHLQGRFASDCLMALAGV